MLVTRDIAERSSHLVASSRIDSLSIFFSARSAGQSGLTYLFHHGISEEAQHAYKDGRVFEDDPFPGAIESTDRCGQLIHWGDTRIAQAAQKSRKYHQFINCHSVDVVGAWVQQILPQFYLVIGAHCRPGGHRKCDVSHGLLAKESAAISQMIVSHLLEETVAGGGGRQLLGAALLDTKVSETKVSNQGADDPSAVLSSRELQIAQLVGAGSQNKQVAFMTGISEFTVENHLRRIYRKLNVHNRAAMTARLIGSQTRQ